jgi:hypothetical protein
MDFSFGPWDAAAERLARRTPVAAPLTSAEWGDVPLALRDRAFWSARVESARLVSQMHNDLAAAFTDARDSRGRRFDRDNFIGRARDLAVADGITTTGDPAEMGGIKDIRSIPRLGLIYDTNTTMASNWARQRTDFAAGALDAYPAWRFERIEDRLRPRGEAFWRGRWQQAGAAVGWVGANPAAMAALKTSPIWTALSAFNTPWPPFDYGSSRMLEDVAYQIRTPEFWNACAGVCDASDYRLGGSFFDGKGQPGQVSAVSHGSSTARFNGINVINTARSLG